MQDVLGTLTLVISKKSSQKLDDFKAKFSDYNVENVEVMGFKLMDGNLHSFKVHDHNIKWEDE